MVKLKPYFAIAIKMEMVKMDNSEDKNHKKILYLISSLPVKPNKLN